MLKPEPVDTSGMGHEERAKVWTRSFAQVIPAAMVNKHRASSLATQDALIYFGPSRGNALSVPLSTEDQALLAQTLCAAMGRDAMLAAIDGEE